MRDKNFKNLNEQIEIFQYKGLTINNEEYTKNILLRENYFFISGYRHLFMKSEDSKKFINNREQCKIYYFISIIKKIWL